MPGTTQPGPPITTLSHQRWRLAAVRSGRIEELRHAYELNELKPELGAEPVGVPFASTKTTLAVSTIFRSVPDAAISSKAS